MNHEMKEVVEKMTNIIEDGISIDGYPIFTLERPVMVELDGRNRLMYGTQEDFIFYTTDEVLNKQLRKQLDDYKRDSYVDDESLRKFLYEHQEFILDNRANPLQKLKNSAGTAYVNLTTEYQGTMENIQYGACHLMQDDKIFVFRCWFDGMNRDNSNIGLKGLYDKPIQTQEQVEERYVIVKDLYEKGEITPEVIITGNAAKKASQHIINENKKLPTNYQQELMDVLTEFAALENYDIKKEFNLDNVVIVLHTEKFGDVHMQIPRSKEKTIDIKYGDVSQQVKSLKNILMQFHVDRTKEKVEKLSQRLRV